MESWFLWLFLIVFLLGDNAVVKLGVENCRQSYSASVDRSRIKFIGLYGEKITRLVSVLENNTLLPHEKVNCGFPCLGKIHIFVI